MDRDMRVDCMIDLETMDVKPTAIILSIGACLFDINTGHIVDKFYKVLSIDDQVLAGRTISESTLLWWLGQSEEAREAVFGEYLKRSPLNNSIYLLSRFIPSKTRVWSNGATFDISMLENTYKDFKAPWNFWDVRDVRTIVDLCEGGVSKHDTKFEGVVHNALDDAIYQAKYVSAMWQYLRKDIDL